MGKRPIQVLTRIVLVCDTGPMPGTPTSPAQPERGAGDDWEWDVDQEWLDAESLRTLAAEDAARYGDPDDGIPVPVFFDDDRFADEELLAMRGPVSGWDVVLLSSIHPGTLSVEGRLAYARRVEAVKALAAAMDATSLVALAGVGLSDSMADRHATMEVALVRRVGEGAAASAIATARALHVEFPAFRAALAAGEVSEWHCRVLVSETSHVTDPDTIAALQDRLLPKAKRKTPTEFRRLVRAAVADLDAEREAQRVARARAGRYVSCKQLPDGLGYLGIVSDWPTISAMHQVVDARGRALQAARGGAKAVREGDDDALADACRADAFAATVLGTVQADGSQVFDPADIPVSLTLVMDLETLRGEADRHALLDGEPVPAGIARDYAGIATTWRRAVTDPVTGHLLDYGREQYLPDKLRDYVLARDHCRQPGCTTRSPKRLQMDHALPFPDGETSAGNCGGCCNRHHPLKTAGYLDIHDSKADGSATFLTAWGQRISIPPRPFLHDPADHPPAAEPPPDAVDGPPSPAPPPAPPAPPTTASSGPVSRDMFPPQPGRTGFTLRDVGKESDPPF